MTPMPSQIMRGSVSSRPRGLSVGATTKAPHNFGVTRNYYHDTLLNSLKHAPDKVG